MEYGWNMVGMTQSLSKNGSLITNMPFLPYSNQILTILLGSAQTLVDPFGMCGGVSSTPISPCRMCDIQGIRIPSSWITAHYVPLNCDHFSGVNPGYQAHSLPLRNHKTFLKQAVEVQPPQPQSDLPPSMGSRVYLFSLP